MPTIVPQARLRAPRNLDLTGIEGLGDAIGKVGRRRQRQKALETHRNDLAKVAQTARDGGTIEEISNALASATDNRLKLLGIQGLARLRQLQGESAPRSPQRRLEVLSNALPVQSVERPDDTPSLNASAGTVGSELSNSSAANESNNPEFLPEGSAEDSRHALIPPGILDEARPNPTAPDVNREDKRDKGDLTVRNRRGSFLPLSVGKDGNLFFDPTTGVLGAIIDAVTLPGDVLQGKVIPTSNEGLRRAVDLALTTTPATVARAKTGAVDRFPRKPQQDATDRLMRRALTRVGRRATDVSTRPITQLKALRSLTGSGS